MTTPEPARRRFRPGFWPTAFTVPALAVLVGLGVWQLERLAWKEALIIARATGMAAPPLREPFALNLETDSFRRVIVTGVFLHDREMHLAARSLRGNFGYHLVTPLKRAIGGHVLVNRGWVPPERKNPASRVAGQVTGEVTVTGVVRGAGGKTSFTPDNDPGANMWFTLEPAAMATHAGLADVVSWVIEADATANPGGLPLGGQTRTKIPNDHLQYAITWFLLAIVLVVIYVLFHRRRSSGPMQSNDGTK